MRHQYSAFNFLDEFRLVISTGGVTSREDEPGLIIFDTSVPQQSPDSWRRLNIAPTHHKRYAMNPRSWEAQIHVDSERSQGGGSCDGPLIVDQAQSVVVIVLHHRERVALPGADVVLVVRAASLVRYLSSTPSGQPIPWNKWKGDTMAVEFPNIGASYVQTFVLGTHVLLITCRRGNYIVRGYDFSWWGCKALVRVGDGRKERRVMPNLEKVWSRREPNVGLETMLTLGDSLVMCMVGGSQPNRTEDLPVVREECSFSQRDMCLGVGLVVDHHVDTFWARMSVSVYDNSAGSFSGFDFVRIDYRKNSCVVRLDYDLQIRKTDVWQKLANQTNTGVPLGLGRPWTFPYI